MKRAEEIKTALAQGENVSKGLFSTFNPKIFLFNVFCLKNKLVTVELQQQIKVLRRERILKTKMKLQSFERVFLQR
jgi:hypothetical protein